MALNLGWRLAFLPACQSAYTDGILQVDMFRQGVSFWPPLYAVLARLLVWIPGLGLEGAGRAVSILCGVGVLWPLLAVTRRLFGLRAGLWAMAAWTATPMALQWSLHVMTDMPFAFFWMGTLAAALCAVESYRPGLFPRQEIAPAPTPVQGAQWLLIASACGALATLVRWQGVLLLAPLGVAAWQLRRVAHALPGRHGPNPLVTLLPWLAVPAWLLQGAGSLARHMHQIGARTGAGVWPTLLNYWNVFEDFLLKSPYFLGYGVFGFMLYGLFRTQWTTERLRGWGWLCLYLGLAVFGMQAVFSSYQARYLLPLVPLACLFAGHGLATWERHSEGRMVKFWGLVLPTLAYGLIISALVVVYQGNPFKDIKDAALFVKGLNLPEGRRVLANETYNAELSTVKTSFWSGRKVALLDLSKEPPRPGDIIILSSYNATNLSLYYDIRELLLKNCGARKLAAFARTAVPLMTDIMDNGLYAQNPMGWVLRYQPQRFETIVLEIPGAARPEMKNEPLQPIPPEATEAAAEKMKALRGIHDELKTLKGEQEVKK